MAKTPSKKKTSKKVKEEVVVAELNPVLPHIRDFTGLERTFKNRH